MLQEKYSHAFRTAEKHTKQAEKFLNRLNENGDVLFLRGLLFPAVNELRCAAYHAILANDSTDSVEKEEEFTSAKKHCERASFDALEAQIQYLIGLCDIFQDDYRLIDDIGEVIKNYQEDCLVLDSIIDETPARSDYEHREDYWEVLERHLEQLKPICKRWKIGRQELNKKLTKERRNRRNENIKVIGTIFTIGAAIFGVVFSVVSKLFL